MLLFVLSARQKAQHASADFKTELKDLYKRKRPEGDGCHSLASLFGLFALIEINALSFLFTPGAMLGNLNVQIESDTCFQETSY